MKKIYFLLFMACLTGMLSAQNEKNFIDQNYIEVIGKADKEVLPDNIYLSITINDKDVKGKSLTTLEKEMMQQLQLLGIDVSKDLAVKDLESNFKNYWIFKTSIIASKEYALKLHDAATAGKVMIALQNIGISNVSIDRTEYSKMKALQLEVKTEAIKSAQTTAEALCQAIHQTIGRAIYIMELQNYNAVMPPSRLMMVKNYNRNENPDAPKEPIIEFQPIKVEASVMVRFELK
ncbi:MAG: SIMPL domain-containing protein [Microbacter sp.]